MIQVGRGYLASLATFFFQWRWLAELLSSTSVDFGWFFQERSVGKVGLLLEERKITYLLRCNSNLVNDFLLFLSVLLIAMKAIKGTLVTWLVQSKDKETREQLTWSHSAQPWFHHSDPAVKQLILSINATDRFVIEDLDETHLLISTDAIQRMRDAVDQEVSNPRKEKSSFTPSLSAGIRGLLPCSQVSLNDRAKIMVVLLSLYVSAENADCAFLFVSSFPSSPLLCPALHSSSSSWRRTPMF